MTGPGLRARLLGGTASVAGGLVVAGAGTVAMLALAARALPAEDYAPFAVWWTVATLLTFGFGVFEAYLARLVVTDVALGRDPSATTADVAGRAATAAAVVGAACLLLAPLTAASLFDGALGLALLLPVFVAATAAQTVLRGLATGLRRFDAVAAQLAADGVLRAATAGLLLALGEGRPEVFAVAACAAAALSLVAGDRRCPAWRVRPLLRGGTAPVRPLLLLLVGAVGPVLANSGTAPWLAATGALDPVVVGAFVGALTLCRLPTQFLAAAFGPLLNELAHAVEAGDQSGFRRLQRTADAACVLACGLFVGVVALAGPALLRLFLGAGYDLPVSTLALLATASGLLMLATVRQAGLAALDRWGVIAVAWSAGTLALGAVLALPADALLRAAAAPVAAGVVAVAVLVLSRPRVGPVRA